MKVKVELFANLREIVGKKEVEEEIHEGSTVFGLVKHMAKKYGKEFESFIFDENGEIQAFITILAGEKELTKVTSGFNVELKEGERVAILLPFFGG
ncbi:MAG: MoaD family protein [Euryarchaeota archaeon]|nr:MoaD family protein [Euryarchaeota archaeon]